MKRVIGWLLVLGLYWIVAGIAGCGILWKDGGTYRARLTLAVDTPQGPREASSVLEFS